MATWSRPVLREAKFVSEIDESISTSLIYPVGADCQGCLEKALGFCCYRFQRACGISTPDASASGASFRNRESWKRDKASAISFSTPGM